MKLARFEPFGRALLASWAVLFAYRTIFVVRAEHGPQAWLVLVGLGR